MKVPHADPLRRWIRSVRPKRADLRADVLAAIPGAVSNVPDGMATSVLAGVNPIHGLYACFAGPIAGGLTASTRLMVITTTSAAALAAGSAVSGVDPADRPGALFMLSLLAGGLMIAAGIARLGRYTRFVSHSVMIGFLSGVAVNIVLGQIPDLVGAEASGSFALAKAVDVLTHPSRIELASLLTGLGALVLMAVLDRTRLSTMAAVIALFIPTVVVIAVGADVLRVNDVGEIVRGLPAPGLPALGDISFKVIVGAFAVSAIVLVQGAGVAEAAPNPPGEPANANRDFIAQGVGNLASGIFKGQPVGGSVGSTALNRASGARSRWASIFCGVWMAVVLIALSPVVGKVAMPTLAAVLIYAGVSSLRLGEITTIMRTGPTSQIALVTTFVATLFLPVAVAVGIGVALSLLLQLNQEALDLRVVELVTRPDGKVEQRPAPRVAAAHTVIVLDVYGSLYYAGSRTLQAKLPDPTGSDQPVVILRLRGRTSAGATFFAVLADYARQIQLADGRLYLSGLDHALLEQMRRSHRLDTIESVHPFEATTIIGQSTRDAYRDATAWLVRHREEDDDVDQS